MLYSDEYIGCIASTVKVKSEYNLLEEYTKCGMLMKLSKCSKFVTARGAVTGRDGKMHTLTMFHNVISSIVDCIDRWM